MGYKQDKFEALNEIVAQGLANLYKECMILMPRLAPAQFMILVMGQGIKSLDNAYKAIYKNKPK